MSMSITIAEAIALLTKLTGTAPTVDAGAPATQQLNALHGQITALFVDKPTVMAPNAAAITALRGVNVRADGTADVSNAFVIPTADRATGQLTPEAAILRQAWAQLNVANAALRIKGACVSQAATDSGKVNVVCTLANGLVVSVGAGVSGQFTIHSVDAYRLREAGEFVTATWPDGTIQLRIELVPVPGTARISPAYAGPPPSDDYAAA